MSNADEVTGPEVLLERRGEIAIVLLNRAKERNSITRTLGSNLLNVLELLDRDETVSAVVLSAMGHAFCAGGKIGEVIGPISISPREQYRAFNDIVRATSRLRTMELPVICAVNGPAVGGGAALALACDLVIAAEEATLSFMFGQVGATAADMGCAYLLPRLVGIPRARQLLLTGATLNATQGRQDGLFLDVVPRDRLLDTAMELARSVIASGPRNVVGATKAVMMRGETTDFDTCLYYETFLQSYFLSSDEHKQRAIDLMSSKTKADR